MTNDPELGKHHSLWFLPATLSSRSLTLKGLIVWHSALQGRYHCLVCSFRNCKYTWIPSWCDVLGEEVPVLLQEEQTQTLIVCL